MSGKTEKQQNDKKLKKRPRKTHSGLVRNKSRTKSHLVEAVGKVIKKKGYTALNDPNIAKEARLHKKLIWTYFGGVDNLVEEYLRQKNFWRSDEERQVRDMLESQQKIGKNEIYTLLENYFNNLMEDGLLRKIIHWELEGGNKVLRKIADQRREVGEEFFKIIEPDFLDSDTDLRANIALQLGSIIWPFTPNRTEVLSAG